MDDETKKFFLIIFIISSLLISGSVILYFICREEKVFEYFDCYVFSIFWTPTTCTTKNSGNYECFQKIKELGDDKYFTLHGLWPSLLSGKIPPSCNSGNNITPSFDNDKAFKDKLEKYWPGLYSNNSYLWMNEYNKHGFCYIQRNYLNVLDDYKIYFNKSISMFENGYRDLMEQILPDSKGVYNVSKAKFKNWLKKSKLKLTKNDTYALICDKATNQLSEIRFILDLNFQRAKSESSQENCPDVFVLNFTDESKQTVYDKYDFYIYALSYGPTLCKSIGKRCYDLLKTKEYNRFIIHGLWPSYKNGIIPQVCNIDLDIEVEDDGSEYFINLKKYWYGLNLDDQKFYTHEYNNHGFCYNKRINKDINNYKIFLDKTMEIYNSNNFVNLFNYIYDGFLPRVQKVNKTYLIQKLHESNYTDSSYFLTCSKIKNEFYLEEIRFKLDLDFNFITDGKSNDNCPEEFMIEILDGPKKTYDDDPYVVEKYDVYTYSIFFQSSTCKEYGYHCYNALENFPKNMWTIHGLWPNYKNISDIPGWCNGKNDIEIEIKNQTLYNYMKTYWPGLFSTNERFWGHEYNRHGFCYNKRNNITVNDYEVFFLKAISIYEKYDLKNIFYNMFNNQLDKGDRKITAKEVEDYFAKIGIEKGSYYLICNFINIDSKNVPYIGEIRIRFDLDFNLYKSESDKVDYECPSEFWVEFL